MVKTVEMWLAGRTNMEVALYVRRARMKGPPIQECFVSPNVPDIGFSYNATPQAGFKPASPMGYGLGVR